MLALSPLPARCGRRLVAECVVRGIKMISRSVPLARLRMLDRFPERPLGCHLLFSVGITCAVNLSEFCSRFLRLGPKLRALAEQGVYFGTSSWKYEGWLGSIYTPERYFTRGKLSKEVRGECLARVRCDVPDRLRRLRVLPVPHARLLGAALSEHAPVIPVRLQGARRDHRGHVAWACAVRRASRARQRRLPRRESVPALLHSPARALRARRWQT